MRSGSIQYISFTAVVLLPCLLFFPSKSNAASMIEKLELNQCGEGWDPSCKDDPNYKTRLGIPCSTIALGGFECRKFHLLSMTNDEVQELIDSCPCSCGIECGTYKAPVPITRDVEPDEETPREKTLIGLVNSPTKVPTYAPTTPPTLRPSRGPTVSPSAVPTAVPSHRPSQVRSYRPSKAPTTISTYQPSLSPTSHPTTVHPTWPPSGSPTESSTQSIVSGGTLVIPDTVAGAQVADSSSPREAASPDEAAAAHETSQSTLSDNANGNDEIVPDALIEDSGSTTETGPGLSHEAANGQENTTQSVVAEETNADTDAVADDLSSDGGSSPKDAGPSDHEAAFQETPTQSTVSKGADANTETTLIGPVAESRTTDGEAQAAPEPIDETTMAESNGNMSTPKPSNQPTVVPSFLPTSTPTASPTVALTKAFDVPSTLESKQPTSNSHTIAIVDSQRFSDTKKRATDPPDETSTAIDSFATPIPAASSSIVNRSMSKGAIATVLLLLFCVMALTGYYVYIVQKKRRMATTSDIESENEMDEKNDDNDATSRESHEHEGTHELVGQFSRRSKTNDSDPGVLFGVRNDSQVLMPGQVSIVSVEKLVANAIKECENGLSCGSNEREIVSSGESEVTKEQLDAIAIKECEEELSRGPSEMEIKQQNAESEVTKEQRDAFAIKECEDGLSCDLRGLERERTAASTVSEAGIEVGGGD